uniref:Glycoside hydrolase family 31 protein n=1 Tax=Roseihalotalea indica TaxID=2867963 RepID=A0AA49GN11_9BACT|nr:glycoside hydrolase family 31 protein [Tunicatimonas sp. TK19036]
MTRIHHNLINKVIAFFIHTIQQKNCGAFLSFFLISSVTVAQTPTAVGNYQSGFEQKGNVVTFSNENADVRLEFCTPTMLRVRTSWNRQFEENEPWMVVKYDWPTVELDADEEEDHFTLKTEALNVTITKQPFSLEVATIDGLVLTSEQGPGGSFQEGEAVLTRKQLLPDEHFFGFGERMDLMDRRGSKVQLNVGRGQGRPHIVGAYNILKANYCPVPFFMSTRGYGIFLHNAYASEWDMGATQPDQYSFQADGGEMDYYLMYGPDFPTILDQYTTLTGKSPLLPMFALGLHVGTYSGGTWGHEELTSTQYVIALARKFRELGIPIDILHLDSTWRIFGKVGGTGATSFEWRDTFDDPEAMFDSLYAMNLNMVGLHLRPRFDNGQKLNLLDQARAKGYTYPEADNPGEFVNFFDQEAVDWWWDNGVERIASIGAMFLKTDEGSAFGQKANESDKIGPTGKEVEKLHNLFPLAYAKAPYEKFAEYNQQRGMNHTREGYAGIQRYPFIFAGDWPSEWQYFAPVIKAGLNVGMSGVGYWAHCMGGFEHDADPELYIRWCQFGLLSPIAHLFGMDHPGYKEPWNYGEDALRNFKKYDDLRYQLIPYLYSHAYEMYETGMPLMRALVLEHQNDVNTYDIADQYMLGSQLMVCPVTTKGAQTRVVYLPEGTWFDYWTGTQYEGEQYISVRTPLDTIPVFAKGGAIIPMQPVVNYIGEHPIDTITLDLFPKGNTEFVLYDDDGKSLAYQQDTYATTTIRCEEATGTTRVHIGQPQGNYSVPERSYRLKVHTATAPTEVTSGQKKLEKATTMTASSGWYYNDEAQILYIQSAGDSTEEISVEITY